MSSIAAKVVIKIWNSFVSLALQNEMLKLAVRKEIYAFVGGSSYGCSLNYI